jgi:hypothetical protein
MMKITLLAMLLTLALLIGCMRDEASSKLIPVGVTLLSLDPPSLIGPNDGKFLWSSNSVLARWRAVPGAQRYQFELSEDSTFVRVREVHVLDSTSVRSQALPSGKYYWHVRAIAGNLQSKWSERRSFWRKDRE